MAGVTLSAKNSPSALQRDFYIPYVKLEKNRKNTSKQLECLCNVHDVLTYTFREISAFTSHTFN